MDNPSEPWLISKYNNVVGTLKVGLYPTNEEGTINHAREHNFNKDPIHHLNRRFFVKVCI